MSEKPTPVHGRPFYGPRRRLELIRQAMHDGKTQAEMARICGVSARTVVRDLQAWRESGGFEEWLEQEFLELHQQVKVQDPKAAYREIAALKGKTLKQRLEAEVTGAAPIIVRMYDPLQDEARKNAEAAAARARGDPDPVLAPPKAAGVPPGPVSG